MKVLLDTCVLSELRHPKGSRVVNAAIQRLPSDALFLSVISLGEIIKGISLLENGQRKTDLEYWVQTIEHEYKKRILPIDHETVRIWGELTAHAQKKGKIIPVSDGLVAATAIANGLHVMTRNISDFERTGAMLINPWS